MVMLEAQDDDIGKDLNWRFLKVIDTFHRIIEILTFLMSMDNPLSFAAIVGLSILGIPVPVAVEPALFLISYHAGPISIPVLIFIVALQVGRHPENSISTIRNSHRNFGYHIRRRDHIFGVSSQDRVAGSKYSNRNLDNIGYNVCYYRNTVSGKFYKEPVY